MAEKTETKAGVAPAATGAQVDAAAAILQRELNAFERKLASDDRAREKAKKVTLMAVTAFTIFGEEDHPDGRIVNAGDEFEVSEFDLPRFIGKGHPKVEHDADAKPGVKITPA